jgi:acetyl esterase/lipase
MPPLPPDHAAPTSQPPQETTARARTASTAAPSRLRRFRRLRIGTMVLLAAALLGGCSPLVTLNQWLVPSDGYVLSGGLGYGPDPRQQVDVYVPARLDQPAPVVVFFYGGSWRSGSRAYYRFVGEALTSRGVIAVVPDYRLYPDVQFPAFVEDGARVVRWVHEHIAQYGGSTDRLFLMGHSAGAHIAALLATDPRYLAAHDLPRSTVRGLIGMAGPYAIDPQRYRITRAVFAPAEDAAATQPVSFVDGTVPPMLLLHGADDRTVYPINSRLLAERVTDRGGCARLIEYPDLGHIGIVLALAGPFREDGGVLDDASRFIAGP